jgi:hypothetical protein
MAQLQKMYVGIIQEISTTAKKWHNCKKIAQLQKQMHNCKNKCTTAKHIYCIISMLLRHPATAIMTKLPPAEPPAIA